MVTAAHCVYPKNVRNAIRNGSVAVLLGVTTLDRAFHKVIRFNDNAYLSISPDVTIVHVSNVFIHPRFRPADLRNDFAILQLSNPIEFTDKIRPVCLPSKPPNTYEECMTSGWGKTTRLPFLSNLVSGSHSSGSDQLRKLPVVLENRVWCSLKVRRYISRKMICAGNQHFLQIIRRGVCFGDSGGPLTCQREHKNDVRWELCGLVSWGVECGKRYSPEIYTNLYEIIEDIEKKSL